MCCTIEYTVNADYLYAQHIYAIIYLWSYIPSIPNKYARETIPISLSHPLCLILILVHFILCTQDSPSPYRWPDYPYKYTKWKLMQILHKEIYHILSMVDRILKGPPNEQETKKKGSGFQEELLQCNLSRNKISNTYKVCAFFEYFAIC